MVERLNITFASQGARGGTNIDQVPVRRTPVGRWRLGDVVVLRASSCFRLLLAGWRGELTTRAPTRPVLARARPPTSHNMSKRKRDAEAMPAEEGDEEEDLDQEIPFNEDEEEPYSD